MSVRRLVLVFGLAALLAAAPAAADTVVTAAEVIACSVQSVDSSYVRLKLPPGGIRLLPVCDVCEIRLSDSGRAAELAVRLPQLRIVPDSGQSIPSPEQRRQDLSGRARPSGRAGSMDTLAAGASPAEMRGRCEDLKVALFGCGRGDDSVAGLLHEVTCEAEALRGIESRWQMRIPVPAGGVLGMAAGSALGAAIEPPQVCCFSGMYSLGGCGWGCAAGGVLGLLAGVIFGRIPYERFLTKHRSRINDLVRRFNRANALQR
jgi:hypothetical protein